MTRTEARLLIYLKGEGLAGSIRATGTDELLATGVGLTFLGTPADDAAGARLTSNDGAAWVRALSDRINADERTAFVAALEDEVERPQGKAMSWTQRELWAALERYEQDCIRNGMRPKSVNSYWIYARRFLNWRTGEYRPRGTKAPPPFVAIAATVDDLTREASLYAEEVRAGPRHPASVETYYRHAMFFVRWLAGEFEPGARLGGAAGA